MPLSQPQPQPFKSRDTPPLPNKTRNINTDTSLLMKSLPPTSRNLLTADSWQDLNSDLRRHYPNLEHSLRVRDHHLLVMATTTATEPRWHTTPSRPSLNQDPSSGDTSASGIKTFHGRLPSPTVAPTGIKSSVLPPGRTGALASTTPAPSASTLPGSIRTMELTSPRSSKRPLISQLSQT